jgi:hypothetical protein
MTCASRPFAVLAALLALAAAARAEDPSEADRLFRDGRALLKDGRIAEACVRFEDSLALDRAFGTLLNLGDCWERLGRTASAWRAFGEAAELARADGRPDRIALATSRVAAVEPRLCRLSVEVAPGSALVVSIDGRRVDPGTPVLVDPGRHVIEASGVFREIVDVSQPGTRVVRVAATPAEAIGPPPAPLVDRGADRRLAGQIVAGAGVVAVAAGAVFGVRAAQRWSDAQDACGEPGCPMSSVDGAREAGRDADLSTGFLAGGLVAVAGGMILWLTAPDSPVRPTPKGLAASWRF